MYALTRDQAFRINKHYTHIRDCCISNIENYQRQLNTAPDEHRKTHLSEKIRYCEESLPEYEAIIEATDTTKK